MQTTQVFLFCLARRWDHQCTFPQRGKIHQRGVAAARDDQLRVGKEGGEFIAVRVRYAGQSTMAKYAALFRQAAYQEVMSRDFLQLFGQRGIQH